MAESSLCILVVDVSSCKVASIELYSAKESITTAGALPRFMSRASLLSITLSIYFLVSFRKEAKVVDCILLSDFGRIYSTNICNRVFNFKDMDN